MKYRPRVIAWWLAADLLVPALAGAAAADLSIGTGGATASAFAERLAPPAHSTGRFLTLPPGAVLPSESSCATAVQPALETRPSNDTANHTTGTPVAGLERVSGAFAGTTDEILQWVACKWGIDEDVVRAQIAKESWWRQDARGDLTQDQSLCHPLERAPSGPCPESVGLGQVRYQYHRLAFEGDNAIVSSAFNVDYTYSVWRSCFEGEMTWLNTVERGAEYGPGDAWGCVGVWYSGRWYTPAAVGYITTVRDYLSRRVWEQPEFVESG